MIFWNASSEFNPFEKTKASKTEEILLLKKKVLELEQYSKTLQQLLESRSTIVFV